MTLVKVNNPIAKSFDGFLNELLNDMPTAFGKNVRENVFGFPPVNIDEHTNSYQLQVAAPGWNKADFSLKLDNNILTVSAEKKEEAPVEQVKSIRREFGSKSFKRSFTLDDKIDAANIGASYENGILTVTLPKKEEAKAVAKEITIA